MSLWVAEHGKIFRSHQNKPLENGDLHLAGSDFDSLFDLLEDSEHADLAPVLKYSKANGKDVLTVQQYVGVIQTATGCQIEILPKTSKNTSPAQARETLVKMLMELRESPFRQGVLSNLDAHRMPLFELLMRQFLERVSDIVRKGIARAYVPQQDNLVFLRGKLQLSEHIKRNCADKSRFYCEFDEFEADRPINRLIKGALEVVARSSQNATTLQQCREFLFWFDRVRATRDVENDFRSIRHDRHVQHYQPAMPTCRLILQGLNPLTKQGGNRTLSMLFPMHQVFEDYVAAKLRSKLWGWKIRSQVSSRSLVQQHKGTPMFRLNPDLEFSKGPHRLIGDTKWKLISHDKGSNNYGISQSDVYQLYAYAKKYLADQPTKRVILIYPRTDHFESPLEPFWFEESKEMLYVLPFDLETGELLLDGKLDPFELDLQEHPIAAG